MASEIEQAIRFVCEEKGLSYESVMETIESALAAAYRKDYGNKQQNIEVNFDPATAELEAFDIKTVVEDISPEELEVMQERQAQKAAELEAQKAAPEELKKVSPSVIPSESERRAEGSPDAEDAGDEEEDEGQSFNPKTEIMFSDAQVMKMGSKVGDELRIPLPMPGEFGRMAAMTAKQVITQKLREAEREIVYNEYKEHEGEVIIGTVQRKEGRVVWVEIGKTTGVILPMDQVRTERYESGSRIKVFVREVSLGTRGPQILLSRSSEELVRALFDIEIPEIADDIVQIKSISREAGHRTKVAVSTDDESIDPIGACIGQRGVRIQTIINEIGGEKIDVIEWSNDDKQFIENALAPAKIESVELNEEEKIAVISVDKDQLSLAIGRGGQNVRLASELTGWRISVNEQESDQVSEPDKDIDEEVEEINSTVIPSEAEGSLESEVSTEEIAEDEQEESEEEQEKVEEDNE